MDAPKQGYACVVNALHYSAHSKFRTPGGAGFFLKPTFRGLSDYKNTGVILHWIGRGELSESGLKIIIGFIFWETWSHLSTLFGRI